MYPKHIPDLVKPFAKDLTFSIPNEQNEVYLTFDDGPHPVITPWVLQQLEAFEAKATFFLIGKHVQEHPEIVSDILDQGHAIGLHGFGHLSGWETENDAYFEDIELGAEGLQTKLLRPPYGRITASQTKKLKQHYRIIMWSDLSADFDSKYTSEECARFATHKVKGGSIVVFHDSEKAWPRLEKALPMALEFYREKGFRLAPIPQP